MITRNNITELAYNAQTTVDGKHNLPFDFDVTNTNDAKAECSKAICGKAVQRSGFQEYVDRSKNRIEENRQLYRK